jgi:hypothetical protein
LYYSRTIVEPSVASFNNLPFRASLKVSISVRTRSFLAVHRIGVNTAMPNSWSAGDSVFGTMHLEDISGVDESERFNRYSASFPCRYRLNPASCALISDWLKTDLPPWLTRCGIDDAS